MVDLISQADQPTTLPIASRRHQPLKELDEVAAAKDTEKQEHHIDNGLARNRGTPDSDPSASEHREKEQEKSRGIKHNVSIAGEIDHSTLKKDLHSVSRPRKIFTHKNQV